MATYGKLIEFFEAGLFDANGDPLNGYQVRSYQSDGSTANNVWEERAKSTPKSEFSLSTTGNATVYGDSLYIFKIWTATADPDVDSPYDTIGPVDITFDAEGDVTGDVTGDLTGDVYASNGTSKVLDNGTDGSDGVLTGAEIQADDGTKVFDPGTAAGDVTLNIGSDATGDTYYRNSSGKFVRLGIGTNDDVLMVKAGIPAWNAGGSGSGLDADTIDGLEVSELHGTETFTSSGTFNVPSHVDRVFVTIVAGGGGGGDPTGVGNAGGGGGGGGVLESFPFDVTPSGTETVTIGAGGASATVGGDSIFGTITVKGGLAGGNALTGAAARAGSTYGGDGGAANNAGSAGQNSSRYSGGAGGSADVTNGGGGGGGAGYFGNGAAGGNNNATGSAASANTGAGGGGGGGGAATAGGAGGSGKIIVAW